MMKVEKEKTVSVFRGRSVTVKAWLSLFCGYWYVFLTPLLYWFSVFFSSEVELRPYTPAACSLMTFWAEYKVEVAIVLVALPGAARVLPQLLPPLLPRSSLSMIRTCSEAPFVRPPLMDAASELPACLVDYHALKWAWFALVLKLLLSGLPWWMQPASFVRILWSSIPVKSGAYCAFDLCLMCVCACWSMFCLLYKLS